jgi:hypothetical protein
MQRSSPKHLAESRGYPGLTRNSLLIESVGALLAVVLAVTLVVAFVIDRPGSRVTPRRARSSMPATSAATAPAAPTAASAPATPAPAATRPHDRGNLLGDPGFEAGLGRWRPVGGGRLERVGAARSGSWAASLAPGSSPDPGAAVADVTGCQPRRLYTASAWVRASTPGTTVAFNLLEYVHGRRFAVDTVGAVLAGTAWERVEVEHFTHVPNARLGLEIVASGLSPEVTVLVDDVEVRATATSQTFATNH